MVRKTVTLVFCDVADSTPLGERLDPESLRGVWSSYHETAREVLERHGGTIEKFVGDAVMAAFGIPVVHEDDALRAVRAAVELREALAALNDRLDAAYGDQDRGAHGRQHRRGDRRRPGAGPRVRDRRRRRRRAAARSRRRRRARSSSATRPSGWCETRSSPIRCRALELKGKSEPVAAWRLHDVFPDAAGVTRRLDTPLVGRVVELARSGRRRPGRAGALLPRRHGPRRRRRRQVAPRGRARRGRWARTLSPRGPLPAVRERDHLLAARRDRPRGLDLDEVLAGEPDGETVHGRLLEAVGRAEPHSRSDELYWAFRRLLETLARARPVLLVLDDVQWAEPAFLDLIEYLAGWTRDAPILVCCLARSDLAELRPAWAGSRRSSWRRCSATMRRQLLENLGGPLDQDAADAVGRATGGNPLFLEEMLRMLVEDGVLVEREGRLEAVDRRRVDPRARRPSRPCSPRGSTGSSRGALGPPACGRDRPGVLVGRGRRSDTTRGSAGGRRRSAGARQEGADPSRPGTFAGEDAFRFGHILVRDAAYDSMTKGLRADLHERCADGSKRGLTRRRSSTRFWVTTSSRPSGRAPTSASTTSAPRRSPRRAPGAWAGRRALRSRARRQPRRGRAARADAGAGRHPRTTAARSCCSSSGSRSAAPAASATQERRSPRPRRRPVRGGDDVLAQRAAGAASPPAALHDPGRRYRRAARDGARGDRPSSRPPGDAPGLVEAWSLVADVYWVRCRIERMGDAIERALAAAEQAPQREHSPVLNSLARTATLGPLPVADGLALCADVAARCGDDRTLGR